MTLEPCFFAGKGERGDFEWELSQDQSAGTLFLYGGMEESRLATSDTGDASGLQQYNFANRGEMARTAGVTVGTEQGGNYSTLSSRARALIDTDLANIERLLRTKRFTSVRYIADNMHPERMSTGLNPAGQDVLRHIASGLRSTIHRVNALPPPTGPAASEVRTEDTPASTPARQGRPPLPAIGARVRVRWGDGEFDATVQTHSEEQRQFSVLFDDDGLVGHGIMRSQIVGDARMPQPRPRAVTCGRTCVGCSQSLPKSKFSASQYRKPKDESRCRYCIEPTARAGMKAKHRPASSKVPRSRRPGVVRRSARGGDTASEQSPGDMVEVLFDTTWHSGRFDKEVAAGL